MTEQQFMQRTQERIEQLRDEQRLLHERLATDLRQLQAVDRRDLQADVEHQLEVESLLGEVPPEERRADAAEAQIHARQAHDGERIGQLFAARGRDVALHGTGTLGADLDVPGSARTHTPHPHLDPERNSLGEGFAQRLLETKPDLVAIDAARRALDPELGR